MSDEILNQEPADIDQAEVEPADCEPCASEAEAAEDAEAVEETPEEIAAREAAEKAAREEEEAQRRRAAEAAAREERAQAAVDKLGQGAGFNAQYGVYYDATHGVVKATSAAAKMPPLGMPGDLNPEQECVDPSDVAYQQAEEDLAAQAQDAEAEAGYIDPVVFGRQVAKVTQAVTRNPVQRELFYKVLAFCEESQPLRAIEEKVQSFAEFGRCATNPYHFIKILENAGGLERFDIDEEGDVVTAERKQGLTEDEIDDLVVEYAFMTTPAGQAVVDQHTPRARIIELLGLVPERKDTYIELMGFLSEEPRTYNEVSQLLTGRDVLWHLDSRGNPEKMQPSVFLDKLHAAAAIEWRTGWVLTEEGRAYLDELKNL